jgi:hypothetical protein
MGRMKYGAVHHLRIGEELLTKALTKSYSSHIVTDISVINFVPSICEVILEKHA